MIEPLQRKSAASNLMGGERLELNLATVWKFVCSALASAAVYIWGPADEWLYALLAMIVLDYFSGVIAAIINRELSSAVGFRGDTQEGAVSDHRGSCEYCRHVNRFKRHGAKRRNRLFNRQRRAQHFGKCRTLRAQKAAGAHFHVETASDRRRIAFKKPGLKMSPGFLENPYLTNRSSYHRINRLFSLFLRGAIWGLLNFLLLR